MRGVMLREEAKVGSLEIRAKVRGDEWVRRLTAGRDIVKKWKKDQFQYPRTINGRNWKVKRRSNSIEGKEERKNEGREKYRGQVPGLTSFCRGSVTVG